jgi:hypothetical protein
LVTPALVTPALVTPVASLLVSLLAAFVAAPASAHLDGAEPYTHNNCASTASTRVDPINIVFHGWGTWGRAVSQIEAHAGWTATSGSYQWFVDDASCYSMHGQRASGEGSRFHVRIRGQHPDETLGWTATGDAHHEDLVMVPWPCGHAVDSNGPGGSGFDQGRNELRDRFEAAGHSWSLVWWGNTQSFKQCDGDYAASDGWTVFVQLHQVNH